jgi:hypothetical protein
MDEARRVLERLERIETLRARRARPPELISELRALVDEGKAWLERERAARDEHGLRPQGAGGLGDGRAPASRGASAVPAASRIHDAPAGSPAPGPDGALVRGTSSPEPAHGTIAAHVVEPLQQSGTVDALTGADAARAEAALDALDRALADRASVSAAAEEVVSATDAA